MSISFPGIQPSYGIPKWYKPCSHYPDDSVEFLKTWNIEGAVHLNKVKLASWAYATNLTPENAAASRKEKQLGIPVPKALAGKGPLT